MGVQRVGRLPMARGSRARREKGKGERKSRRLWVRVVRVVGVVGLLAGCSTVQTGARLRPQDCGKGAQYKVEVSLNGTMLGLMETPFSRDGRERSDVSAL